MSGDLVVVKLAQLCPLPHTIPGALGFLEISALCSPLGIQV